MKSITIGDAGRTKELVASEQAPGTTSFFEANSWDAKHRRKSNITPQVMEGTEIASCQNGMTARMETPPKVECACVAEPQEPGH
jgi:hypothetical protein